MKQKIDIKPLSVNQCWQGRRFKTKLYKQYELAVYCALKKIKQIEGRVKVKITLYLKYPKKSDIDNPVKPIIDIMNKKNWIRDDRDIYRLEIVKKQSDEEGFMIEVMNC